jgi:hypothetical protein
MSDHPCLLTIAESQLHDPSTPKNSFIQSLDLMMEDMCWTALGYVIFGDITMISDVLDAIFYQAA